MNLIISAFKVPIPDILSAAGIGILLTFVVLFVLIGLLYAFKAILSLFGKKSKKAQKEASPSSQDDKALVAAIMGAVSAYRDDDNVDIKITSIKKQ